MENIRLEDLMQNDIFMKKVIEAENLDDVRILFMEHGVELDDHDMEIMSRAISEAFKKGGDLTEEDLKKISGSAKTGTLQNSESNDAYQVADTIAAAIIPMTCTDAKWKFAEGQNYNKSWWK